MTFVPVEKLPERGERYTENRVAHKPIRAYLEEFMKMNVKYARVDYTSNDYSNAQAAWIGLRESVKRAALPITIVRRVDDIYLIRRDLEDPNERL